VTLDPIPPSALAFTLQVERLYAALLHSAETREQEPSLGGKLLYVGELGPHGRALLVAGNIAGAASLAATADVAVQKQSIREGVADFLVNSLGEALRILKNEIRKRETVAVCVAAAPAAVELEMLERGVLPDLLPPIEIPDVENGQVLISWRVAAAPAQWLPKLDRIALDCLNELPNPESAAVRRWLRLAPRYLGRLAQGLRLLHCEPGVAKRFVARAGEAVQRGEIAVEVEITLNAGEEPLRLHPPTSSAPHP
jgi:urocanate hydratase